MRFKVTKAWRQSAALFIGLTVIEAPLLNWVLRAMGSPVIAWLLTALHVSAVCLVIYRIRGVRLEAIPKDQVERIERTDSLRANVVLVMKDGSRMRLSIEDVDGFEAAIRR